MARLVKGGLIQTGSSHDGDAPLDVIKKAMIEKHLKFTEDAAKKGVQVLCFQEIFYGPYFCAEQKTRWYDTAEKIPDGPTTQLMCETAKRLGMVLVVPIYEVDLPGVYYNTAAVIDAVPGQISKTSHPALPAGFLGEVLFQTRQPWVSRVRNCRW